jgi:hypothetical protein
MNLFHLKILLKLKITHSVTRKNSFIYQQVLIQTYSRILLLNIN